MNEQASDSDLLQSALIYKIIGLALLAGCLGYAFFQPALPLFSGQNPFLLCMTTQLWGAIPSDNRRFIFAYKVFLCILLALVPLSTVRNRALCLAARGLERHLSADWLAWLLNLSAGIFLSWSLLNFNGTATQQIAALFLSVYGFWLLKRGLGSQPVLCALTLLIVMLGAIGPGFFVPRDFSSQRPIDLMQIMQHYNMCLGFADKLAQGVQLLSSTRLYYGLLIPCFLGLWQKAFGTLSFGDLYNFVLLAQLVLLALIVAIQWQLARRWKELSLAAFLSVVTWYHFNQVGSFYPNQSGWRYGPCFLALLVILNLRRISGKWQPAILGLIAGLAALANIETGLVIAIGTALCLILLRGSFGGLGRRWLAAGAVPYILGLAAALLGFALCFTVFFGYAPRFLDPQKLSIYFKAVETICMQGFVAPVAVWIFLHAAYTFVRIAIMPTDAISGRQLFRFCTALLLISIELYYFNRPFLNNLAGPMTFYSFFMIDSLRAIRLLLKGRLRPRKTEIVVCAAALAAIVLPSILMAAGDSLRPYLAGLAPCSEKQKEERMLLSGVYMPKVMAQYLQDKMNFAREFAATEKYCYVSVYSFLVPRMAHREQQFPFTDPMFSVNSTRDFDEYVATLIKMRAPFILLDSPKGDPALSGQDWFERYSFGLKYFLKADYELWKEEHGWQILRRREGAGRNGR